MNYFYKILTDFFVKNEVNCISAYPAFNLQFKTSSTLMTLFITTKYNSFLNLRNFLSVKCMIAWYRTIWCQCTSSNVIDYFHRDHNAPCLIPPRFPKKKMHTLCFQFLLGITNLPREIEGNALICKLLGVNKVHYGILQNGQFVCLSSVFPQCHTLSHSFCKIQRQFFNAI